MALFIYVAKNDTDALTGDQILSVSATLKHYLLYLLYFIERYLPRSRQKPPTKILVPAYLGIGNMILLLPAIRALKQHFPSATVTIQTSGTYHCEDLVKDTPWIDEVSYFDRNTATFPQKIKFLFSYWREGYDLLFTNMHYPGYLWSLAALAIPRRIGPSSKHYTDRQFECCFTDTADIDHLQHELEMDLEPLTALGLEPAQVERSLEIVVGEQEADEYIQRKGGLPTGPLIAISPNVSKGQMWKRWPMVRMAALTERLIAEQNATIAIIGALSDRAENVAVFGEGKPLLWQASGELSLKGVAGLLKQCDLVIGNDSGILHIAAAVGTKSLLIAGPTKVKRSRPYTDKLEIVTKSFDCQPCYVEYGDEERVNRCPHRNCLAMLTVDEVMASICRSKENW